MKKVQTFNDGIAKVYEVTNIALPGNQPKQGISKKFDMRFAFRTVGMERFYTAQQYEISVSELIAIPQNRNICVHDVVVLSNSERQFIIEQIQHKDDTAPATSLLTLSKLEANYDAGTI